MEDLEAAPGSPALQPGQEPEGLDDPGDPQQPGVEEEDRPNAPLGDPTADVDAFEDEEAPETVAAMNEQEEAEDRGERVSIHDSGEGSELEELDEGQFEDFDPANLNIPDKPVQVDETNVGLLGVHKRKRTDEEQEEARKKKKKERKREKPKRERKRRDDDDGFEGGPEMEGKRGRKGKGGGERAPRRARTPENEENLTPEERRRRALERKMDEAVKSHRPSRRRGGIDLEAAADAEIEEMRRRMAKACELDSEARARGDVATHKLKILPEVVELMNRNTIQTQLVDPDTNLLEAVRFMLEPADQDAALPNYKIQRELFNILGKLNISKEALIASQIGKVILFYTKSSQPETGIKHAADKLLAEWMRTVLKKQKDMRHKPVQTKTYDPSQAATQARPARAQAEILEERRRKALAMPQPGNRARVEGGAETYTIAPQNNMSSAMGLGGQGAARAGTRGEETFRRITQNANKARR